MSTWYHLSTLGGATGVGLPDTDSSTTIQPRVARYVGGELHGQPMEGTPLRISAGPSIWQCFISISHATGNRDIYKVTTPAEPNAPAGVHDLDATAERWLTPAWLAAHAATTTLDWVGSLANIEEQWDSIHARFRVEASPYLIGKHVEDEVDHWTVDEVRAWIFRTEELPALCGYAGIP